MTADQKVKTTRIVRNILITASIVLIFAAFVVVMLFIVTPQVKYLDVAIDADEQTMQYITGAGSYEENAQVTLVALKRDGYEFQGFIFKGEQVSGVVEEVDQYIYTFTLTEDTAGTYTPVYNSISNPVNKIIITLDSNGGNKYSPIYCDYGQAIGHLPIAVRAGYEFDGWYTTIDGGEQINERTVALTDTTYYAHWKIVTYTVTVNLNGGECDGNQKLTYHYNVETPTFTLPTNVTYGDYTFTGYTNSTSPFANVMKSVSIHEGTTGNKTYYANYHTTKTPTAPAYQRVDQDQTPNIQGDYIIFGLYPQTLANDVTNSFIQNDQGYILVNDEFYMPCRVTAYNSDSKFNDETQVITGQIYYFKVEPMLWKILKPNEDGSLLLLNENVISGMDYQENYHNERFYNQYGYYPNNYKESTVRAWLNNEFYSLAFTAEQQELIQQTTVDNSKETTSNPSENQYCCENTDDNIFLLSYQDMLNTEYGFSNDHNTYDDARKMGATDYAIAKGVYRSDSKYNNHYISSYWLRSPSYNGSSAAGCVEFDGKVYDSSYINSTYGVIPALTFRPDKTYVTVNLNGGTKGNAPESVEYNAENNAVTFIFDKDTQAESRVINFTPVHDNVYEKEVTFVGFAMCEDLITSDDNQANKNLPITDKGGYYYCDAWYKMDYSGDKYSSTYKRVDAQGSEQQAGEYIQLGYFPKTLKPAEVEVADLHCVKLNNFLDINDDLAIDNEGYVYAKQTAHPYVRETFLDDTYINAGEDYYFKIEPMLWKILYTNEEDGSLLLFNANIITAMAYQAEYKYNNDNGNSFCNTHNYYPSNYKESTVRAWLNGEFLKAGFNNNQQQLIQQTTVDNSKETTSNQSENQYCCDNTNDKVFLLSFQDMLKAEYGFTSNISDDARSRSLTDYSIANGETGSGYYYLRSPSDGDSIYSIRSGGWYTTVVNVDSAIGVVPAITVKLPTE